jgi:hypothetical protein
MARRALAITTGFTLVALAACARGDDTAYDTAAGMTSGAMATPPAIGMTTGATTSVLDSIVADSIRRDSIRRDSIRRDTTP